MAIINTYRGLETNNSTLKLLKAPFSFDISKFVVRVENLNCMRNKHNVENINAH